jgi:hypothetical protein
MPERDKTTPSSASSSGATKLALAVGVLGAYSIVVPFLGDAIGLDINVAAKLEVVDHVIPGVVAALSAAFAYGKLRSGTAGASLAYLAAVGAAILAGLWITTTHIPLLLQAGRDSVGWAPALWHSIPGIPVFILAGVLYAVSPTEDKERPKPA